MDDLDTFAMLIVAGGGTHAVVGLRSHIGPRRLECLRHK
jgi:hypothetical protein